MMNLEQMSREQLEALVMQMKADSQRKLSMKVSEKGAVAVYGLGKFPVTLYASQWERLIEHVTSGAVTRFIAENEAALSRKG